MPLMMGRLYSALRAADVPDDKAREAAEEVAAFWLPREPDYNSRDPGPARVPGKVGPMSGPMVGHMNASAAA